MWITSFLVLFIFSHQIQTGVGNPFPRMFYGLNEEGSFNGHENPEVELPQKVLQTPRKFFPTTSSSEQVQKAVCVINVGTTSSGISGTLLFRQNNDVVVINGEVSGLKPNTKHGFHVHQFGDTRNGCTSTGDHFNPFNKNHGGPNDIIRHVGDTGNIMSNNDGKAIINITDKQLSLNGIRSIIGRAVVVHEGEDDLGKGNSTSLINGNAGPRIGCGIIGIMASS